MLLSVKKSNLHDFFLKICAFFQKSPNEIHIRLDFVKTFSQKSGQTSILVNLSCLSDETESLRTIKGHENGVRCVYLKFPYGMSGSRLVILTLKLKGVAYFGCLGCKGLVGKYDPL